MFDLDVTVSGPLFDGRAVAALDEFVVDATETVADEGVNMVRRRLGSVLQNPTGRYESRIQTERAREDRVVTDGRSVKGPWLEGTSSRNQTTRFKGYRTFRIVTDELQERAHTIAERRLPPYLGRMQ